NRLVVGVGVIRDPADGIRRTLNMSDGERIFSLVLQQALTSAVEAQVSASAIKTTIDRVTAKLRPAGIDLFYVGPAAFAVVLGHRWNALPTTQMYEYDSAAGKYLPSVAVGLPGMTANHISVRA